jgi:hypothetical protein
LYIPVVLRLLLELCFGFKINLRQVFRICSCYVGAVRWTRSQSDLQTAVYRSPIQGQDIGSCQRQFNATAAWLEKRACGAFQKATCSVFDQPTNISAD